MQGKIKGVDFVLEQIVVLLLNMENQEKMEKVRNLEIDMHRAEAEEALLLDAHLDLEVEREKKEPVMERVEQEVLELKDQANQLRVKMGGFTSNIQY